VGCAGGVAAGTPCTPISAQFPRVVTFALQILLTEFEEFYIFKASQS
jgi:hypothetical protein